MGGRAVAKRRRAPVLLAPFLAAAAWFPAPARPADAQEPAGVPCSSAEDFCVEVGDGGPSGPGGGGGGSGGGGGARCTSRPLGGDTGDGIGLDLPNDPGPRPAPDSVLLFVECEGEAGRVVWWTPGDPESTTPAGLAEQVFARLEGSLPAPLVVSSPGPGVAAIVGYPSFVAVGNWTGPVTDSECDPADPSFCVSVVARPALTWVPGEPDAEPVACAGSGTRYDPAAGRLADQAEADGACAHVFRRRTGVDGRPGEWPGVVTVRWTLTYTSRLGDGVLPDVVKSAPVPRAVDEAQTVVESAG